MLKKFTQMVSKIPFAGKALIRPAFRNFLVAKDSKKPAAYKWVSFILSVMIFGHARQAVMGINALRIAIVFRMKMFWHVVFVGYTAANIAVTIAQVYVLAICTYYYFAKKKTGLIGKQEDFTGTELALMLFVTMSGQILFAYGNEIAEKLGPLAS